MKFDHGEGILVKDIGENRPKKMLADLCRGADHLPLKDLVDGVDMINSFFPDPSDLLLVPLVDGVDADVTRSPSGVGCSSDIPQVARICYH